MVLGEEASHPRGTEGSFSSRRFEEFQSAGRVDPLEGASPGILGNAWHRREEAEKKGMRRADSSETESR